MPRHLWVGSIGNNHRSATLQSPEGCFHLMGDVGSKDEIQTFAGSSHHTLNLQRDITYNVILRNLSTYRNVLEQLRSSENTLSPCTLPSPTLARAAYRQTNLPFVFSVSSLQDSVPGLTTSTWDLLCLYLVSSLVFGPSLKLSTLSFCKWGLCSSPPLPICCCTLRV